MKFLGPNSGAAKRADLSHRTTSCLKDWTSKTRDPLRQVATVATLSSIAAQAASFNPKSIQANLWGSVTHRGFGNFGGETLQEAASSAAVKNDRKATT